MGYDYFLSEPLKGKFNAFANDVVRTYQAQLDEELNEKIGTFKSWLPTLATGVFYILVLVAIFIGVKLISLAKSPIFIIPAMILLIGSLRFSIKASRDLSSAFAHGLMPLTRPMLLRVVTSFLLYSSKGSVAALGMLFLITAFICRYINAYHL
ncbi:hypothetical protein [Chromobacterium vaccinii]|uniref:hypothetical protein n=1 Tax=Chromobacterium vaccinii TaxID=1108595 RepID=UPI001319DFB5|nr:hypothetical protein [Chromobacterium vaccinii]